MRQREQVDDGQRKATVRDVDHSRARSLHEHPTMGRVRTADDDLDTL